MKDRIFDAGALKHKRLTTLMQMVLAFLTAIVLGLMFSPSQIALPLDKNTILIYVFVLIVGLLIGFNYLLGKLERTLGWREEETEEKLSKKK